MFGVLQRAKHSVLTGFGLSERSYGGWERLAAGLAAIQGVMQGNGAGPMIWLAISTVLVSCMIDSGYGAVFVTAITCKTLQFAGFLFVDDSDNIHTAKDPTIQAVDILQEFQDSVDCWEGLLRSTGGGINPRRDKSFWCLIDFRWTGTQWRYLTANEAPGEISVRSPTPDQERVTLQRIEPGEAKVTLGVSIAFDGSWTGETTYLTNKAKEYASKLKPSRLTRQEAWYSITNVILMTMKYPLAAVSLSKQQWDGIMSIILTAGLLKSGISKNFPKVMRFCPLLYQGLDIRHLYDEMHLEHLLVILDQCNRITLTGRLLEVCYEAVQRDICLPGPMTDHDFDQVGHLVTSSWMKDVWRYCWEHSITIRSPLPGLRLQRQQDQFLMQAFIAANYSGADLKTLQNCMQYMCSMTLSDLATADGSRLTQAAFDGVYDGQQSGGLHWPRSPPPLPAASWDLWQEAISTCFVDTTTLNSTLLAPLGLWTTDPRPTSRCMLSVSERRLFLRDDPDDDWEVHTTHSRRIRKGTNFLNPHITTTDLPDDARPATSIWHVNGGLILDSVAPETYLAIPPPLPVQPTLLGFIQHTLDPIDLWAVESITCTDNGQNLAASIAAGTARGVSDGSFKEGRGTSAFILHGSDPTFTLLGKNRLPGPLDLQSPYRSEAGGYYGGLIAINILRQVHNITTGSCDLRLDGESVINKLEGYAPIRPGDKHYDLLLACQHQRQQLKEAGIKVTLSYVAGHADAKKKPHQLTWWEQQNIVVDREAKSFLRATWDREPNLQHIGGQSWQLSWQAQPLSYLDKTNLYERMYAPIVRPYLARKLALPHKTLRKINWKASNQALRRMPKGKRRWLTKHTTGFCGVGRSMHIRKIWDHSRCPRCAQDDETPKHVLLCPSRGARLTWAEALVSLDKHLRKLGTNQSLRYGIIEHLRAWGKRSPPRLGPLRADVRAALAEQTEIGWYNLLLGRISHRFTQLQEAHYKSLGNRRNGFRWTTAVIRKLLDISWDMWDHRNHIKHNDPHPAFDPHLRTTLNEEIRFQWSLGAASLRPEDRPLFRHGLDSIMEQTTTNKQQWLASVENARSAAAADQVQPRNDQNYERNLMENWIIRGPPAN